MKSLHKHIILRNWLLTCWLHWCGFRFVLLGFFVIPIHHGIAIFIVFPGQGWRLTVDVHAFSAGKDLVESLHTVSCEGVLSGFFLFLLDHCGVVKHLRRHLEGLTHDLKELGCDIDSLICRQVGISKVELVTNPLGQLLEIIFPLIPLVCKDHLPIVILGTEYSTYTLRSLAHGIEGQEVLISDLIILLKELHACS